MLNKDSNICSKLDLILQLHFHFTLIFGFLIILRFALSQKRKACGHEHKFSISNLSYFTLTLVFEFFLGLHEPQKNDGLWAFI